MNILSQVKTLFKSVAICLAAMLVFPTTETLADTQTGAAAQSYVSDSVITTKIKGKLAANEVTKATAINVETENGVVALSGTVESATEANEAVQIAESISGVKDVKTLDLHVKNNNGSTMADSYITAKIKGALVRESLVGDESIPATSIHVETKNSVVYLSGKVENKAQKNKAVEITKSVPDVKRVVDTLKVGK